jgi:alpha/beta superfamily hydrolase
MEDHIFFDSKNIQLEGMINQPLTDKGVVITHPHPQYGGDMYNHVVTSITHVLKNKGYTTLRFNFRGVGKSQGKYDNGNGEQQDVISAINYLSGIGIKQIDLAGYSFGAWINALVAGNNPVIKHTLMVSPPVAFVDFSPVALIKSLKLVVTGTNDDFAPVELINKSVQVWNPAARIQIIAGADHFYSTHMMELENALDGF